MNTLIKYLKRCINLIPICHLSTENIFPIIQSETPLEVLLWGNLGVIVFSHESRSFYFPLLLPCLSVPVFNKEKHHDFYVFLFPLHFVLYFSYLAILSISATTSLFVLYRLLPRYFFILLLPCLTVPVSCKEKPFFTIHDSRITAFLLPTSSTLSCPTLPDKKIIKIKMPEEGIEPTLPKEETDFESVASSSSATPAYPILYFFLDLSSPKTSQIQKTFFSNLTGFVLSIF